MDIALRNHFPLRPSLVAPTLLICDSAISMAIDHLLICDFEATCDAGEEELLSRLEQCHQHEIIEFVRVATSPCARSADARIAFTF